MRIKVSLNPKRDLELVALRLNPAIDFNGIIKEVLRSYMKNVTYRFEVPKTTNYTIRSFVCYVTLDDNKDSEVIQYLSKINMPVSSFIKNIILRAIVSDVRYLYTDTNLSNVISSCELERKRNINLQKLKKQLEKRRTV